MVISAHELRLWTQSCQRAVRLAVNTLASIEECWATYKAEGRQLVENLTNQIILTDSFESGGLGALHGINGLKEEVLRKSKEKEYSLLKDLRDTVEGLSETSTRASRLRDDFDRDANASWSDRSPEDQRALQGRHVFLSLSMDQLSHEFDKIATMLGKEHVVKSAILEAYEMAVLGGTETGRPTTYQTRRGINQMVKESGHLGGSRSNKEAVDTMTVYIATWTLEPEIDGTAIPTLLSMVRDEMKAVGYSVTLRLLILLDTAGTITYLLIPCGYFNVVHCGVMVTGWIPLGGESLDSLAIRLGHILA